jgi:hypothetical protein
MSTIDGGHYQLTRLPVRAGRPDGYIYSAFFVKEEGTMSSFRGLEDVILEKGLFGSLYTDRGSHYWYGAGEVF